jgi:hypothetical protein
MTLEKTRILHGNIHKIIAAVFMVIDHVGYMLFPQHIIFRILGRIAYPIFAFMIAEGAKYTKNKAKYLLTLATFALVCQLFYYFALNDLYMCILVTFTLSICVIYALQFFKKCLFDKECKVVVKILSGVVFVLSVHFVAIANRYLKIDYGFYGCMVPVFASLFDFRGLEVPKALKKMDCLYVRLAAFAVGLIILAHHSAKIQYYSLFAVLLLLFYSGSRGRPKMKYFFYIFYPLHLVVLTAIQFALKILK